MSEENKKYWTDDDELVEKYVLGKISAEAKRRLDAEIADCEACKEKIRAESELIAGIRRHGHDWMKSQLRTKLRREKASQFYSYQYIGLAAAVIIIAIGIGLYQVWFSDLVAPKQFQQQEIVLKPQEDTTGRKIVTDDRIERRSEQQQRKEIADNGVRNDAMPSSSAAGAAPERAQEPAVAMADADAVAGESNTADQSSAIWLIGKVVMISDESSTRTIAASKSGDREKGERALAKESVAESEQKEKVFIARRAKDERIILHQRPVNELPAERFGRRQEHEVETLVERTEKGISITFFDDSVKPADLQQAMVETFTDDSLIVSLPNQRIAFRFPEGWYSQPSRR
ncbi:MAG: hypothetical protein WCW35_11360 [Bacteroidota bacterium]